MPVVLRKFREWFIRYYPAEIVGTVGALAGAYAAHTITGSVAVAAIAGSVAETVGFYGYFVWHDGRTHYRRHRRTGRLRRVWLTVLYTVRGLAVEFGPAELLDSFFVRPASMYAGQELFGFAGGVLAGKLAADLVFYGIAVVGYESKKLWFHAFPANGTLVPQRVETEPEMIDVASLVPWR